MGPNWMVKLHRSAEAEGKRKVVKIYIARNGFAGNLNCVIYMDKWQSESLHKSYHHQKTWKTNQHFSGMDPWEGSSESNLAFASIHKRCE